MLPQDLDSIHRGFQCASIICTISFFLITTLAQSFMSNKEASRKRFNLWVLEICVSCILVLMTAFESFVAARLSDPYSTGDPELVYYLFLNLTWTILLLGLFSCWGATGHPHYGAWSILLFCSGGAFAIKRNREATTHLSLVLMLQICCLGLNSVLIGIGILRHVVAVPKNEATVDEAQPLLRSEEPSEAKEDSEEKDQEELDREKIRSRPFWQYMASFKIFLPYMYPSSHQQQAYFLGMCVCTILCRGMAFATPLCLGRVVDSFNGSEMPWKAIILYGSLKLVNSEAGILLVHDWLSVKMSIDMATSLNRHAYNSMMNLSAEFHDSKKSFITWSIIHNGQQVIGLFNDTLFVLIPMLLDLIVAASVLTYMFGPYMLYTITFTTVMFYWIMLSTLKQKTTLRRSYVDAFYDADQQMSESSSNWTTVNQFGQIQYEIDRYRNKSSAVKLLLMSYYVYDLLARALRQIVPALSFIAACAIAALQIIHHQHKIGDFVVLITYWTQLMSPLGSLAREFSSIGEKLVSAEKLLVLLEKSPKVCDQELAIPFIFKAGAVEFQNVTFSYDGERIVTEGINFHAEAGKTTAIVGPSGGGKSTIFSLLYRSYDIQEGRILIDGQDIKTLQMASFRKSIATVPQNPQVFNSKFKFSAKEGLQGQTRPDSILIDDETSSRLPGSYL